MNSRYFIVLLVFFLIASTCKKEEDSYIPTVPVDLYVYASSPEFFNLNISGGWIYLNGGYRGILVYRKSLDEFMAYDRHCTYQPTNSCALVSVDSSYIMAIDTCCGSSFLLSDGSVTGGPAMYPLKTYQTTFDGDVLHIFN